MRSRYLIIQSPSPVDPIQTKIVQGLNDFSGLGATLLITLTIPVSLFIAKHFAKGLLVNASELFDEKINSMVKQFGEDTAEIKEVIEKLNKSADNLSRQLSELEMRMTRQEDKLPIMQDKWDSKLNVIANALLQRCKSLDNRMALCEKQIAQIQHFLNSRSSFKTRDDN